VLAEAVSAELAEVDGGRVAVIVPVGAAADVRKSLTAALPDGTVGADDPAGLDAPVSVLTVRQAKGLEFDSVIVVEPAEILAGSARGATDLYVAVTRPTQRLGVIHSGELPAMLHRLVDA
jgi:DNA helicase IV